MVRQEHGLVGLWKSYHLTVMHACTTVALAYDQERLTQPFVSRANGPTKLDRFSVDIS